MNKILGINDEVTTCECCGRSDLKATIVIGDEHGNIIGRYGAMCAKRFLDSGKTANKLTQLARAIQNLRNELETEYAQIAELLQDRGIINMVIRERTGSAWNELGLNQPMKPEARRDIYLAWKRAGIEKMISEYAMR